MRPSKLPFAATLTLALTLACQSPPPKSDPASTNATGPKATPAKEASTAKAPEDERGCEAPALRAELEGYCEFDLGVPPINLPRVRWSAPSYHPLVTRVITLDEGGLTDPEGEGTVSIQAWLADPPRRIPEPGVMVLAIAAQVPAATVAELMRGLAAAGRLEIRVLVHVEDPRPIPTPRITKMLADMREALPADNNERVMFVARGVRAYGQSCPPLGEAFGQLANVSPGERCMKLAELSSAAIVECRCGQIDEVMTMLYALTMGFETPSGRAAAVPVRLDPQRKIFPEASTTWGQVVAANLTDTELHQLWIEARPKP